MTIIVHVEKSNSFLCIQSIHDKYSEGQMYTREQIFKPLMNMLKRSSWIISEEEYSGYWHVLKITNNNMSLLFIPVVCSKCFPKYDDDIPITKYYDIKEDGWLRCRRCEHTWEEEAYKFVVGVLSHRDLRNFG